MFSNTESESSPDLSTIFHLCNPDKLGRIRIEFLQNLAWSYTDLGEFKNNFQVCLFLIVLNI